VAVRWLGALPTRCTLPTDLRFPIFCQLHSYHHPFLALRRHLILCDLLLLCSAEYFHYVPFSYHASDKGDGGAGTAERLVACLRLCPPMLRLRTGWERRGEEEREREEALLNMP
jgi:hypothetical protein